MKAYTLVMDVIGALLFVLALPLAITAMYMGWPPGM